MAIEADCSVSTVLEAPRVAGTAGFLVPGGCFATLATRPSTPAPRRHDVTGGLAAAVKHRRQRVAHGLLLRMRPEFTPLPPAV